MADDATDAARDPRGDDVCDAVRRVQAGDPEAYRVLVETFQRPLFVVLSRYVRQSEDAMDLVQRALLRAYERLDSLDDPAAFRSWLFRIGVNLALNHRRRSGRGDETPLDDVDEPGVSATAERIVLHRERMARVHDALDNLTPMQRDVLLLRLEGELTHKEIAAQIDSTPGSVRVHYHNAVKRLRKLLAPEQAQVDTRRKRTSR